MNDYYFTFGSAHYPGDKYFVYIPAESIDVARNKMHSIFNEYWTFSYDSREAAGIDKYNLKEYVIPTDIPTIHIKLTSMAIVEQTQTIEATTTDHAKYLADKQMNDHVWKYKELAPIKGIGIEIA